MLDDTKRKPRRNASGDGLDVARDTLSKPRFWNAPNSVSIARLALVIYALFSCATEKSQDNNIVSVAREDHRILWLDLIPSFKQERLEADQHLAWNYGRYLFVIMTACGAALDGLDGYVARKTGQTSHFGAILDTIVDRTISTIAWGAMIIAVISDNATDRQTFLFCALAICQVAFEWSAAVVILCSGFTREVDQKCRDIKSNAYAPHRQSHWKSSFSEAERPWLVITYFGSGMWNPLAAWAQVCHLALPLVIILGADERLASLVIPGFLVWEGMTVYLLVDSVNTLLQLGSGLSSISTPQKECT